MEAAIWAFIGTIVGAMSSIATTWIASRNVHALQSAKLRDERLERAKVLQRETLLSLQEAIHDSLRMHTRAHMESWEAWRRLGTWGQEPLSAEVNEGVMVASRRVTLLVERVSDDELRQKVKALFSLATNGLLASNEREAEAIHRRLAIESIPLLEAVGTVLRTHY